jgi:hypothetical protein
MLYSKTPVSKINKQTKNPTELILFHVHIFNSEGEFNLFTLKLICLLDDHKAARPVYDPGNLQTIWLLVNIKITSY